MYDPAVFFKAEELCSELRSMPNSEVLKPVYRVAKNVVELARLLEDTYDEAERDEIEKLLHEAAQTLREVQKLIKADLKALKSVKVRM